MVIRIHIELPAGDAKPTPKTIDEYFALVFDSSDLDRAMVDDIGRKKTREIAEKLYPEYKEQETKLNDQGKGKNNLDKIKEALANALPSGGGESPRFEDLRKMFGFGQKLTGIYASAETTLKDGIQGQGNYRISYNLTNNKNSPGVDLKIDLNYEVQGGKIIIEVTSISYKANRINVNNEVLVKMVEGAKLSSALIPNILYYRQKITDQLMKRYSTKHVDFKKTTKIYNVDFTTAKSRLQRELGDFKYNSDKSFFLIEKTYNNPDGIYRVANGSIKHKFVISLFPEKNNTLVEFSGDYEYFNDTFGGSSKQGKPEYDLSMSSYMSTVDKILKK